MKPSHLFNVSEQIGAHRAIIPRSQLATSGGVVRMAERGSRVMRHRVECQMSRDERAPRSGPGA
jgi:hypothetical protein